MGGSTDRIERCIAADILRTVFRSHGHTSYSIRSHSHSVTGLGVDSPDRQLHRLEKEEPSQTYQNGSVAN